MQSGALIVVVVEQVVERVVATLLLILRDAIEKLHRVELAVAVAVRLVDHVLPLLLGHVLHVEVSEPLLELLAQVGLLLLNALLVCSLGPKCTFLDDRILTLNNFVPGMRMEM